ncbi:hypothetical protein [Neorhodopirellula pilleata]|uniref:hypothetical protein n=1 Tax=Neorhodopirellula pilleata TaxID=2714738 RepID=UPI0011B48355|nr:hypothetical protein [Neorhodopirellula pilleata]
MSAFQVTTLFIQPKGTNVSETTNDKHGIREAITDKNEKLGENAPGAPFMVVGLSYITILAILCLVIAAVLYFIR